MRELLFRGFVPFEYGSDIINVNGKKIKGYWFEGDPVSLPGKGVYAISPQSEVQEIVDVIPETVGQYTGLYDINGKRIFEHDRIKEISDIYEEYFTVSYSDLSCDGCIEYFKEDCEYEVIGTEFDVVNAPKEIPWEDPEVSADKIRDKIKKGDTIYIVFYRNLVKVVASATVESIVSSGVFANTKRDNISGYYPFEAYKDSWFLSPISATKKLKEKEQLK